MTLVSTIIRDAYRSSNILAINADPTDAQNEEGLRFLQEVVSSVYGLDAGEQLDPLPLGQNNIHRPQGYPWYNQTPDWTNWYVPPNTRLVLNLTAPLTIWLDPNPQDGQRFALQDVSNNLATNTLTINGNGRLIDGATSATFNTNGTNNEYFFQQDSGTWYKVNPLALDATFPFPVKFNKMFSLLLAQTLNPAYGAAMDPQSSATLGKLLNQFKALYRQSQQMPSELGVVRTTGSRRRYYDNTRWGNNQFNSGYAYPVNGPFFF